MPKNGTLENRLLTYSLAAGAVLVGAKTADAQVWGTTVNQTLSGSGTQSLLISFNGANRFRVKHFGGSGDSFILSSYAASYNAYWLKRSGNNRAKALSTNYVVSQSAPNGFAKNAISHRFAAIGFTFANTGASFVGTDKYLGVKFDIGSSTYYGWILVHVAANHSGITVKSYAYNQTANGSITTNGVLPVELTSFSAVVNANKVNLKWTTATEVNNYGFEVERKSNVETHRDASVLWEKIGFVQGAGNSNSPKEYSFVEKTFRIAKER